MLKIKNKKGFSLIELMGVIGILALITTVVLVNFNRMRSQSRDANRLHDAKEIQAALEIYYNRNQSYPTNITPGENFSFNNKTYLDSVPNNPTPRSDGNCGNNNYTYAVVKNGNDYTLNFCLGNNSSDSTRGANLVSKNGLNTLTGLVGWWKFEESSGTNTYDTTGNNNICSIQGSQTKIDLSHGDLNNCKTGLCAKFDGSGELYLDCGISNDFIINSGSISLWFNYKSDVYVEKIHNIIQIRSTDGLNFINLGLTEGAEANLVTYSEGAEVTNISTSPIAVERWYYLVVTWDSNAAHIYIKGSGVNEEITSTGNKALSLTTNETGLLIGSHFNMPNNNWEGYIDDVRIYNRVLSAAEIQATYDSLK